MGTSCSSDGSTSSSGRGGTDREAKKKYRSRVEDRRRVRTGEGGNNSEEESSGSFRKSKKERIESPGGSGSGSKTTLFSVCCCMSSTVSKKRPKAALGKIEDETSLNFYRQILVEEGAIAEDELLPAVEEDLKVITTIELLSSPILKDYSYFATATTVTSSNNFEAATNEESVITVSDTTSNTSSAKHPAAAAGVSPDSTTVNNTPSSFPKSALKKFSHSSHLLGNTNTNDEVPPKRVLSESAPSNVWVTEYPTLETDDEASNNSSSFNYDLSRSNSARFHNRDDDGGFPEELVVVISPLTGRASAGDYPPLVEPNPVIIVPRAKADFGVEDDTPTPPKDMTGIVLSSGESSTTLHPGGGAEGGGVRGNSISASSLSIFLPSTTVPPAPASAGSQSGNNSACQRQLSGSGGGSAATASLYQRRQIVGVLNSDDLTMVPIENTGGNAMVAQCGSSSLHTPIASPSAEAKAAPGGTLLRKRLSNAAFESDSPLTRTPAARIPASTRREAPPPPLEIPTAARSPKAGSGPRTSPWGVSPTKGGFHPNLSTSSFGASLSQGQLIAFGGGVGGPGGSSCVLPPTMNPKAVSLQPEVVALTPTGSQFNGNRSVTFAEKHDPALFGAV